MMKVENICVVLMLIIQPYWCQNSESLEDYNSGTIDIETRSLRNYGKQCNFRGSPGICKTLGQCGRNRRQWSRDKICGERFSGVVCCKSTSPTNQIVATTTKSTGPIWGGRRKATTLRTPSLPNTADLEESEEECGVVLRLQATIFNGKESRGYFPFMVALVMRQGEAHFCGGVLITRRHVLTAAHCFNTISWRDVDVRVGQDDLTKKELPGTEANIKSVKIHEEFSQNGPTRISPLNDIAIITLDRRITRNNIVPICLPKQPKDVSKTGSPGAVAGWGTTSRWGGAGAGVNKLQYTLIPTKNHDECRELYRKLDPESKVIITSDMLCGGNEKTDACRGDSGGPLMYKADWTDNKYQVWGLVSFGPRSCANKELPGVYTRVDQYIDWIKRNIQ